jgi:O-antigen ligase
MSEYKQKSQRAKPARRSLVSLSGSDRPAIAFFATALILGGAGVAYPLLSWVVLMLSVLGIGIALARNGWDDLADIAKAGLFLAGAFWLLLLAQVIPLPKVWWSGLPGHEIAAAIVEATGVKAWYAWSLTPGDTLETILSALPPLAALLLLATGTPTRRIAVLRVIILIAVAEALLGVSQFTSGPDAAPLLYGTTHRGVAVGLFVNRNHTAVFMLISMLLAVLPGVVSLASREDGPAVQAMRAVLVGGLAVAVLATLSRSGVFLLPVALFGAWQLASARRTRVVGLILAGLAGLLAMSLLSMTPPVRALAQRYAYAADDARFDYWHNTWLAVRDAAPFGVGFGSFREVYQTFEPLNQISPSAVNRAHNDFLEVLLAAGAPGAVLLAGLIGLVGSCVVWSRRNAGSRFERRAPLAVALALFLIGAASLVDYPLRGTAIAALVGGLLGLLSKPPQRGRKKVAPGTPGLAQIAGVACLLVLGVWASAVCWAQHFVLVGQPQLAARIQPLNAAAWAGIADEQQIAGDPEASSRAAMRALALTPLDAGALRAEGAARLQLGDEEGGAALLSLGARLGWRDVYTQLWLVQQALAAAVPEVAVQRADALLREHALFDQIVVLLPPLIAEEAGRRALAEQLSFNPGWRAAFFNVAARSDQYRSDDLVRLLGELRNGPAPVRPEETALIRAVFGASGRFQEARRIWLASGGQGELADPGFESQEDFTAASGPYVWRANGLSGVSIQSAKGAEPLTGQALAISSSGAASGPAVAQTVVLAPGRYRVGMSVLGRDPQIARGMGVSLTCTGAKDGSAAAFKASPDVWSTKTTGVSVVKATVVIPADCAAQQFQISVSPQDSGPFSVWVDDAVIEPLR